MWLEVVVVALLAGPAGGVGQLEWLAGSWSGTADGTESEETWIAPKAGTMLGVHRDVKDGRTRGFEFLRIEESDGGLVYLASPGGQPPTPFRMVESGERRVVFENREHDFPQRILYWIDERGHLHARIEGPGGGDGGVKAYEWVWERATGGAVRPSNGGA